MGLADIVVNNLESVDVRNAIGSRVLNLELGNDGGGVLSFILNLGEKFVRFLVRLVKGLVRFTLSSIWGLFTSTMVFLWNFNWNMSDTEIDQQIQARWNALGGLLGSTVGNAVGFLGCGVLPGAVIFSFNQAMGAYVLKNVAEEMGEEFIANLSNLVRYTFMSGVQSLILWGFKSIRKLLKANSSLVTAILGEGNISQEALRAWGEPDSKPWSIAMAVDEKVESIPNTFIRNFVEEFLEEAWDGCVEAGYVVANSIESFIAMEKIKQQQLPVLGENKYVEIKPDRSIDDDRIILAGPEQVLKPIIVSTLTQHQMLEDRDMGAFVGAPLDDYLRAKPRAITLVVQFFSRQTPPWNKTGSQRLVTATYCIPDINRTRIDWSRIKEACGGLNGYMYGRFRVTGLLNNGRQMAVYANSYDEAEDRLRALLHFSTAELIKKPTRTEDRTEDNTGSYLKQPRRVYPAYFTIFNQYQIPGGQGGGIPINGQRYIRKQDRIDLWIDAAPQDFSQRIDQLLRQPGPGGAGT